MNKLMIALLCFMPSLALAQTVVEVFTDHPLALPVIADAHITVFDLSRPEAIKKQSTPALPPNPEQAKQIAQAFFASPEGRVYAEAMREAYRGQVLVAQYNLQKIPAVVFDRGAYVVYGITDVAESIRLYDHHMQTQDGRADE